MQQDLFRCLGTTMCGPDRGDAAFIAESRTAIPWLTELVERQEKIIELLVINSNQDATLLDEYQTDLYDLEAKLAKAVEALKCCARPTTYHAVGPIEEWGSYKAREALAEIKDLPQSEVIGPQKEVEL